MILKTDLLEHQKEAVDKLKKLKVGALYMEQGTGKTRTALELISLRYNAGKVNHILWLCPCSVKKTIEKEIIKHIGEIKNITICGIETLSSSIKTNRQLRELVNAKNVYLIVDESNLVKNHRAKRTERVTWLAEDCKYKLILNGTPISRNEADLFSQWYILDWRILGYKSFWSFAKNHIEWDKHIPKRIVRTLNVDYLTRKIAPYTYQITKEESLELPTKTYMDYYCEMTNNQKSVYDFVAEKLLFEVDEMEPHTIYRLFSGLQNVISGFNVTFNNRKMIKEKMFKDPYDNPRIEILLEIINRFKGKFIIFCKYTHEINDIIEVLNREYGRNAAVPFDGSVTQKVRQEYLSRFKNRVNFLVANKVTAGYGLNLQFCNNIIFYSNDWDFATRSQAEDRVHRIGQNKQVNIIDICAADTLDERILSNLNKKENLVDSFKEMIHKIKDQKNLRKMKDWINGKG